MRTTIEIEIAIRHLPVASVSALIPISKNAYSTSLSTKQVSKEDAALLCKQAGYLWLFHMLASYPEPLDENNFKVLLKERVEFFLKIAESNLYLHIAEQASKKTLTRDQCLDYLDLQYKLLTTYAITMQQKDFNDAVHRITSLVLPIFIKSFGKEESSELFITTIKRQQWIRAETNAIYTNIIEFNSLDNLFAEIKTAEIESVRLNEICHRPYTTKSILETYEEVLNDLTKKIATFERIAATNKLTDSLHKISICKKNLSTKIAELPSIISEANTWQELERENIRRCKLTRLTSEPSKNSDIEPVNPNNRGLRKRSPRGSI